jgi:hypothetical protein
MTVAVEAFGASRHVGDGITERAGPARNDEESPR